MSDNTIDYLEGRVEDLEGRVEDLEGRRVRIAELEAEHKDRRRRVRIAALEAENMDRRRRVRIDELEAENKALREAAYKAMVSAQDEESADAYATLKKALEGGGDE